jgi:SNF2 family DNA or RNA helicase
MRQLSSGFMGFIGDESGERIEIEFQENPKLERLMELIEALPSGRKMVVFYDFTWSGRRILKEIRARHLDAIWIWSGTKDARGDLKRFQTQDGCDIAILQNRVGAYSLDGLQVANYQVFYESPVSVIDREQAEARVRRQGQKHKIFRYDLIMKDTLDRRILEFHREGDTLLEALRRDPRKQLDLRTKGA